MAAAAQEKVTVCHKPGTADEETLKIAAHAVAAHLAHGDYEGECRDGTPIHIVKYTNGQDADEPTGPVLLIGDGILWTYDVTSNAPFQNVVVVDDNGTLRDTSDDFTPTFAGGDANGNNVLDPGEIWEYVAAGAVQLGQYANIGAVFGDASSGETVMDEDLSHYLGINPG